jgi:hypothetical protein
MSPSPSPTREPPPLADSETREEDFCEAPFCPSSVDRPVTVVIIADKRVGKTTLAAALVMAFQRKLDLDLAIGLTTSDDPTYFANILPKALVKRKANPVNEAKALLSRQRDLQTENSALVPRTCMVFDNVFFAGADFKGMTDFFQNAHNANILPIFTSTDASIIPKQLQDATDYVFIARSMRHNTRKNCWKTFGDMYEKYEDFNDALARLGPHSFLVIDKTSRSRNLAQIVSSYTPPLYRPAPITVDDANAYGKWHLLTKDIGDRDSLLEDISACQSFGSRKGRGQSMVLDHVTFEVHGPKVSRLCSALGIVLDK